MADSLAVLTECTTALLKLDHGARVQVLRALTAALDLTEPFRTVLEKAAVEASALVADRDIKSGKRPVAPKKAKEKPARKPAPKARKSPPTNVEEAILQELREGPLAPRVLGSQLNLDPQSSLFKRALSSLLKQRKIVGSGTTNARRYALAKG